MMDKEKCCYEAEPGLECDFMPAFEIIKPAEGESCGEKTQVCAAHLLPSLGPGVFMVYLIAYRDDPGGYNSDMQSVRSFITATERGRELAHGLLEMAIDDPGRIDVLIEMLELVKRQAEEGKHGKGE